MCGKPSKIYAFLYYTGVQTLRLWHRLGRFFAFALQPVLFFLRRTVGKALRQFFSDLGEGFVSFGQGVSHIGERVAEAWKCHPVKGILKVLSLPFAGIRRFPRFTRAMLRTAAFLLSVTVLFSTLQYWQRLTYAVALESGNETWGYIADESVLQGGTNMALERLVGSQELRRLNAKPAMSLSMVHQSDILSEAEVCDLLLRKSGLSLIQACGLYVNGVLQGVVRSERRAEDMLEEILEESRANRPGVTASFFQEVELIQGLYPESMVTAAADLKKSLMTEGTEKQFYEVKEGDTLASIAASTGASAAEIWRLNPDIEGRLTAGQTLMIHSGEPHLQVLVSGTIQYELETPYQVKRVADASKYEGSESIRVRGKNGKTLITATATYLDGEELSSVITSSEVIVEAVDEVIAYGTKKVKKKEYKGGQYASGYFVWPVPFTRNITQQYGNKGHGGLDIAAAGITGQNIIAADGGVVVIAAYRKGTSYGSYGKYVLIDHGGGFQTLYAHCSELLVKPGDIVKQGQVIALVGNTGRSTGPHLHLEMHINGKRTNPLSYIKK